MLSQVSTPNGFIVLKDGVQVYEIRKRTDYDYFDNNKAYDFYDVYADNNLIQTYQLDYPIGYTSYTTTSGQNNTYSLDNLKKNILYDPSTSTLAKKEFSLALAAMASSGLPYHLAYQLVDDLDNSRQPDPIDIIPVTPINTISDPLPEPQPVPVPDPPYYPVPVEQIPTTKEPEPIPQPILPQDQINAYVLPEQDDPYTGGGGGGGGGNYNPIPILPIDSLPATPLPETPINTPIIPDSTIPVSTGKSPLDTFLDGYFKGLSNAANNNTPSQNPKDPNALTIVSFIDFDNSENGKKYAEKLGFKGVDLYNAYTNIDYKWFQDHNFPSNIVTTARIISDYDFLEGAVAGEPQYAELVNSMQKTKTIATGLGGSLMAVPNPFVMAAGAIAGLIGLFGGTIDAANQSLDRADNLYNRYVRDYENASSNQYSDMFMNVGQYAQRQRRARPKCVAYLSSDCGKEHLRYVVRIDTFNTAVDAWFALLDDYGQIEGYKKLLPTVESPALMKSANDTGIGFKLDWSYMLLILAGVALAIFLLIKFK